MKKIKKLLAIISAVTMAMTMSVAAFADATLSRETGDTHTYEVYQIFTATSYDSTSGQFSGIKYGANSTGTLDSDVSTTVLNALSAVNSSSDADKIAVIDNYWNQTKAAFATINNTTATASLPTGYYLIKDTTTSTDGDSINFHVVTVSDGSTALTITDKRDVPTVQKYIKEDSTNTYGKAADYSKGEETIGFRLVGTLPAAADYARYTKYNYTFTDTLTNMTYVANSITAKVYSGYTNANSLGTLYGTLDLTDSNVSLTASDSNISLAFTNLKVAKYTDGTIAAGIPADAVIVVDYNAKFTDAAVTGLNGNPNSVKVTYSNNPNLDSTGTPITTTEDTPIDYAYAFTYEFDGLKVDSTTNQALTSAGFKIRDESGKYAIINSSNVVTGWTTNIASGTEILTTNAGKIIVNGLDAGTYTLKETKVPTGYSAIADVPFTVTATISAVATPTAGSKEYEVTAIGITSTSADMKVNYQGATATSANATNGKVYANILNTPTSTLPTTGGIGTRMFYIIGGALMVFATAVLILKRKMAK